MLERVTPLLLTYDEAPNVRRTLEKLNWAPRVVVLDSGSTDGTQAIVSAFPNTSVYARPFDRHADQWAFGLEQTRIDTEWVLALDADFVLTDALVAELAKLEPPADVGGYQASFVYCIDGRPLRGAAYPPVVVLYRRRGARYEQDGHTQRVRVTGRIADLAGKILHDDRKSLERWFASQIQYARQETDKLASATPGQLKWPDRVRLFVVLAPVLMFFYCLVVKCNLLDGRRGFLYVMQRTVAEILLAALMLEAQLKRAENAQRP
jgi:glycosyltransferase involved in cell wall biosynthesis